MLETPQSTCTAPTTMIRQPLGLRRGTADVLWENSENSNRLCKSIMHCMWEAWQSTFGSNNNTNSDVISHSLTCLISHWQSYCHQAWSVKQSICSGSHVCSLTVTGIWSWHIRHCHECGLSQWETTHTYLHHFMSNWLWWMPQHFTDNKSTLVKVMTWCRQDPELCRHTASVGHNQSKERNA